MTEAKNQNGEVDLSRFVFGSWSIGDWHFGNTEEEVAGNAIRKAIELGWRSFDTAPIYGFGLAEERLGRILSTFRAEEFFLTTKVGLEDRPPHPDSPKFFSTSFRGHERTIYRNLTKTAIKKSVEASLMRLRRDYVDFVLIHFPAPLTPLEETSIALNELYQEGKIRALGVSNVTVDYILKFNRISDLKISLVQDRFNPVHNSANLGLVPFTKKNHIHFMAYSPFAEGLLIDEKQGSRVGDNRSDQGVHSIFKKVSAPVIRRKISEMAELHGLTRSQLILAYVFGTPGINSICIGCRTPEQVSENSKIPLLAESAVNQIREGLETLATS